MFNIAQHSFDLPETFLKKYRNKQPEWGPLGFFTFKRTYARPVDGESRTEEYWETVKRIVEGTFSIQKNHCDANHLPWDERKAQRTAKRMFELMWDFKFLPPGRGMWAMGTDYVAERGGACLNNCGFVSTENIDEEPSMWAEFVMDMSMVGVGVGFDVRGAGKLQVLGAFPPEDVEDGQLMDLRETYKLSDKRTLSLRQGILTFAIPDTREGWVDSLRILLLSYSKGLPLPEFDYSKLREAGEPIKGFGGLSSGPEPLKEMHDYIKEILDAKIEDVLGTADIVDIGNLIGRCVVAGNVRRSAEIIFGEPTDKEFAQLKQDNEKLMHHRWASNNSIFAKVGMDYSWHAKQTAINGEPGYEWLDNARAYGRMVDPPNWKDKNAVGGNPCLEQTLHNYELCTLVETFPARHETFEEYTETLKVAYLYAKTVTLVPTHWKETNAVMTKNRRIGLSQSGIIRAFAKQGRREMIRWCDEGYRFLDTLDTIYSDWLGVPRSIKRTSVKPSGTVSLLPGEPPGIHYPHSEYYLRRIRLSINSPLVKLLDDAGYFIEPEVGKEDSSVVVAFPVHEKDFVRSKNDVSIWEQVNNAVVYQKYWADNQVSITVTFKPEEQGDIQHVLELNEDTLKGISFLPLSEHGYVQAPYEEITQAQYNEACKDLKPIVFNGSRDEDAVPKFCDGDACTI
jgi:adenosylcobalamin-dependent ribonucleoside-triphosphate reductase